jgi:hypothetical protein
MARDQETYRVATYRRAHLLRTGTVPKLASQLAVGGRLAIGDLADQLPGPLLVLITARGHRDPELLAVAEEVLADLMADVLESDVAPWPQCGRVGPVPVVREVQPDDELVACYDAEIPQR